MATILLVEDDNNLREIYEARLKAEGYDIASAHDGEEALVIAKEKKPNLIIADVMMPKISGFEMLDILRNTAGLQDVKIIMLTALGQVEDQQKATSLGADRYLVKSQVTLEDIVNAARELLGATDSEQAPAAAAPATPEPQTPVAAPVVNDQSTSLASTPLTPAPEVPPAAAPIPVAPAPVTDSAVPSNAAVDDKLIDDAATSLSGDSATADATPATDTSTTLVTPEPSTAMATPAAAEPAPSVEASPVTPPDSPTIQPAEDVSPLEVSKDLEEKLKEDSAEVEHSDAPVLPTPDPARNVAMGAEPSSSDPVPIAPPSEQSSDYLSSTDGPQIESSPGSSMKVIQPIPNNQPSINDLLEKETLADAANPSTMDMNPPESADTNPDQPQVIAPTNPDPSASTSSTNDVAL